MEGMLFQGDSLMHLRNDKEQEHIYYLGKYKSPFPNFITYI